MSRWADLARTGRPYVVGVAYQTPEGKVHHLPAPARHADLVRHLLRAEIVDEIDQERLGFVDSRGRYLTRRQAGAVAFRRGQTKTRIRSLTSQDVW